jgi:hypothetical protein
MPYPSTNRVADRARYGLSSAGVLLRTDLTVTFAKNVSKVS